ncbi:MAG: subclass B3 metallo-beta-lactamase [Planctomycetaceae bacterium]|nr:subclass B3 metallo-beta-lactamase [Planctomycetaceae bacterium]
MANVSERIAIAAALLTVFAADFDRFSVSAADTARESPPQATTQPDLKELADDPVRFLQVARGSLKWDEPAEPAHVVGPVYFVGTQGLSSYLITTADGHILLDTGMSGSGPLIEASIRKLGFNPQDIKILLVNHAHVDHIGGHAHLQKLSGARMVALEQERDLIESGGRLDFHYGRYPEFGFDSVKVDQVISDGDVVQLGDVSITALLTSGHTRGSATYVTTITVDGKDHLVAFPDGTSVNPGYRLVGDPSYPGIRDDFERTLRTLESLAPDIWLLPHTEACGLFDRIAQAKKAGVEAWVDPAGYRTWIASRRAAYEAALARELSAPAATPVTVDSFNRAESDMYFSSIVKDGGFGKFHHSRELASIEHQTIVRLNRDTLYSSAVFDLDAGPVTVFLPDAGDRFLSLQTINEDHYAYDVVYEPGRYSFSREKYGTRYLALAVRTLVNPAVPGDLEKVHALQDAITVEQAESGEFEVPHWDAASQTKIRDALIVLGTAGFDSSRMFGRPDEVDPIAHLIGTAVGWGGNPRDAATYIGVTPAQNDGRTPYTLSVKDVPVDGFWSISVYNAAGYFEKNASDAYTINNLTARRNADGSFTVRFGDCDGDAENCLPIMPGWNYTVRLYRPRQEILDGTYKFPEAAPAR